VNISFNPSNIIVRIWLLHVLICRSIATIYIQKHTFSNCENLNFIIIFYVNYRTITKKNKNKITSLYENTPIFKGLGLPFKNASTFHFSIPIGGDSQEESLDIFILLVHIKRSLDN
jgi:hypothetical protein